MTTDSLVVVIDDDASICRATARMLGVSGYRVRTHERPRAYLAEADVIQPACILADIRMPEMDGIQLAKAIRAEGIESPIVFMTATGDVTTVVDAMKQGAVDLLAKPFSAEALLAAVGTAIESGKRAGDRYRSLADLWHMASHLTPREAEVCTLVASGLANKHTAALTSITEKTVKVHRGRVMHKMGAQSLAALVRMVDQLLEDADRTVIRVDGREILRPKPVEIITTTARRLREEAAAGAAR